MLARLYLGRVGGILQADQEGFSNEDGYQILWQFDRDHIGPWKMAVLGSNSAWIAVQMDLANPKHKEAFLNGLGTGASKAVISALLTVPLEMILVAVARGPQGVGEG